MDNDSLILKSLRTFQVKLGVKNGILVMSSNELNRRSSLLILINTSSLQPCWSRKKDFGQRLKLKSMRSNMLLSISQFHSS